MWQTIGLLLAAVVVSLLLVYASQRWTESPSVPSKPPPVHPSAPQRPDRADPFRYTRLVRGTPLEDGVAEAAAAQVRSELDAIELLDRCAWLRRDESRPGAPVIGIEFSHQAPS